MRTFQKCFIVHDFFKCQSIHFDQKGSPFADFLLREIAERIVLFLLFICLFQKPLITSI